MKKISIQIVIIVTLIFGYWSTSENVMAYGAQKVTSLEGITEYKLDNGLRVILFPDSSKPVMTVNITYLVGSRYEGYGETGMAHLLEHLMFKGSKNHADIKRELSERGGAVNGSTWLDRTNYHEVFPASDENLSWALEMEADRMVNSFIAKKDLDSEMTVVRNEYEMGENDASRILLERMMSSAYLWHNYGHSTIGARSDIENVPIERLQDFYRKYYQPDNAVLVIAGSFDEKKALAMLDKSFGKIAKPTRILIPTYTVEPAQDGERSVVLQRVGNIKAVGAVYHIPSASHPDYAALEVLGEILGDTPSGRLHKKLVETGKAVNVEAGTFQLKEPGVIIFEATTRADQDLAEVRTGLLGVIDEAGNTPPSADELEHARNKLLNRMEDELNSPEKMGIQLSEWISLGDWRLFFLHRQQLEAVTAEDVARVAKRYLVAENRTMGEFIPTKEPIRVEIPQTVDITSEMMNLKVTKEIAQGEIFDISPQNIDKRTIIPAPIGDLKMALLPKKTRGEMAQISLKLHFGNEESLKNKLIAGMLTNDMLMHGTEKHNRQEIADSLIKLKATLEVSGDATSAQVDMRVPRENVSEAMKIAAEILRQPAFSQAELTQLKRKVIASLEKRKVDPEAMATNAALRQFAPYDKDDVRYVMDYDEQIEAIGTITVDDIKNFYQEFYGASTGEISAVGDFDALEMTKNVADLLGEWQSKTPYKKIEKSFVDIVPTTLKLNAPDKENATFIAEIPLKITQESPDYPALCMANYLLGGGFLDSRLANRIRNQDGLSYGIGSHLRVNVKDDFGKFMVYAICAPQNIEKVDKDFKEEIVRALKDGFSAAELKKAKAGISQACKVDRATDNSVVSTLRKNLVDNKNFVLNAQLEEKIMALTPQQVLDVMRRYIDVDKFTVIKAGDFNRIEKLN
jgi:zinc protease